MNWATHGVPLLLTLALWWGSTAVIARLIGHTPHTYPRLLLLATLLGFAGLLLLVGLRDTTSVAAAVGALVGAIAVWGWIEVTFLTGKVTGPLPGHSADDEGLLRRAGRAFTAILWHEILIALTVAVAAVLLLGRENDLALLVLLLLWLMRSSAKLNLFLGVRNLGEGFFPPHLRHLLDFMRHRAMNALMPISLLAGTAIAWHFGAASLSAASAYEATASTILSTLAALAVFEHLLMVLPLPAESLWRWSLANRRAAP
ncbi:MAG: putative photosynthetic complex assembly protein PuhE [Gammaproteobacteria bacterium]